MQEKSPSKDVYRKCITKFGSYCTNNMQLSENYFYLYCEITIQTIKDMFFKLRRHLRECMSLQWFGSKARTL